MLAEMLVENSQIKIGTIRLKTFRKCKISFSLQTFNNTETFNNRLKFVRTHLEK